MDVQAIDGSQFAGGVQHLVLSLDQTSGQPGDTLHLTILKQSADPVRRIETFALFTRLNGVQTASWGMTSE
jgi:hypothetical protein